MVWIDILEGRVHHDRSLMEATEDEFQLSWIGIDVPNGIDAVHAGGVIAGINFDCIFVYAKSPVGNGAKLGR